LPADGAITNEAHLVNSKRSILAGFSSGQSDKAMTNAATVKLMK
jgi:hypothetical protein